MNLPTHLVFSNEYKLCFICKICETGGSHPTHTWYTPAVMTQHNQLSTMHPNIQDQLIFFDIIKLPNTNTHQKWSTEQISF